MTTNVANPLGTSNPRGASRQTRTNPTRTTKTVRPSLRQNSLISNPPASLPGAIESHGFYPAIQHFADAITSLPRDYRRHTSLLKEVDAKAWQLEEHLQTLLAQCISGAPTTGLTFTLPSAVGSAANLSEDALMLSAANSVTGAPTDAASQYSTASAASAAVQRRQIFGALRQNLMQIMVTMDEKNHVINNSNEELSKHIRRLDNVWPHLADEISEEARLGSLKHWAYTETNPTKKNNAPTTRREAAANLALLHENEVAQRSESRREAVAAKSKQRLNRLAQIDAGLEEITHPSKKTLTGRVADAPDVSGLGISGAAAGKRKKSEKTLAGMAMEKSLSTALTGSRAMSREPSQQENNKKRKAPAGSLNVARKRLNANQDSPKLVSSPLGGSFGKEAYKRSPALGSARPATSRGRQASNQIARPSSAASQRNANGVQDINNLGGGKSSLSAKDLANNKADRGRDDDNGSRVNGDAGNRPGLLQERRASKQANSRGEIIENATKPMASPQLSIATMPNARGRTSKISTPLVGTFTEADSVGSGANGNGKNKRPARPRAKDHGLHDSLSPKGLPLKRSHKKGAGLVQQQQVVQRKAEVENTTPEEEDEQVGAEDEERYCYCEGPSYGEMVACDNDDCPRQWFHLECLGLKTVPKSASWYCIECKDLAKPKGKVNGNGNGSGSGNGNGGGNGNGNGNGGGR